MTIKPRFDLTPGLSLEQRLDNPKLIDRLAECMGIRANIPNKRDKVAAWIHTEPRLEEYLNLKFGDNPPVAETFSEWDSG